MKLSKDEQLEQYKKYNNNPKRKLWLKNYHLANKEKIKRKRMEKYVLKTKHDFCDVGLCLMCPRKDYSSLWGSSWLSIRHKYKITGKLPRINFTEEEIKIRKRTQNRENRRKNSQSRVANNLRGRLRMALKSQGTLKRNETLKYIGCDKKDFRLHLESKFLDGMTWDNYGKWHIDHIKPISLFDLSVEEEIYKAMHYSNLQPLWAKDNLIKNNKFELSTV